MSKVKIGYSAIAFSATVLLILFTGSKQDLINKNTLAYSNLKDVSIKIEKSKKEYQKTISDQNKKIEEMNLTIQNQNEIVKKNNEVQEKQKQDLIGLRYETSLVSDKYKNLNNDINTLNKNKSNLENEIKQLGIAKLNPEEYIKNNKILIQNNRPNDSSQYSIEYQKVIDLRNEATIVNAKLINIRQQLSIEERKYNNLKLKNAEMELKIKKTMDN